MGKPVQSNKPPFFRECPICHREFGSSSLQIHVARCLDRSQKNPLVVDQVANDAKMKVSPKKKAVLVDTKSTTVAVNNDELSKTKSKSKSKATTIRPKPLHITRSDEDDDDDEVETSLSDELNHSWPSKSISRTVLRSRKRERSKKRFGGGGGGNVSSGEEDSTRPKTATLKRPHILDETLKDKVDMTLTKKEFLAAVKLCSDVAVQRGLPNMRLRAAGSKNNSATGNGSKPVLRTSPESTTSSSSSGGSPYFSKYYLSLIGNNGKKTKTSSNHQLTKQKSEGHHGVNGVNGGKGRHLSEAAMVRPTTTKLRRPTPSLDLPHIHVKSQDLNKPQHVISSRLSRQFKIKGRSKKANSSDETTSLHRDQVRSQGGVGGGGKAKAVAAPKDKVPEPCKSCGRSDFPERLHTHANEKTNKNNQSSPTKSKPWVSPTRHQRPRALSLDTTVIEPLALIEEALAKSAADHEIALNQRNQRRDQIQQKLRQKAMSKASVVSLRVVDITDETDVEMSATNASDAEVDEVSAKIMGNKEQMAVDDSSSNESSSESSKTKGTGSKKHHGKTRPPPPTGPPPAATYVKGSSPVKQNNNNNKVPEDANGNSESSGEASATGNGSDNVLGLVTCSVCGKQFGKNSVKFHVKQCERKQQLLKTKLAKEEQERKENQSYKIDEEEGMESNAIHEAIWEAHVQQLIPCKLCGRTFFPDRIEVHQKSCKRDKLKVTASTAALPNPTTSAVAAEGNLDNLLPSPATNRRTLHNQQDAVITTTTSDSETAPLRLSPPS